MDRETTVTTVLITCEWCQNTLGMATLPYMGERTRLDEVLCDDCILRMRRVSQPEYARSRRGFEVLDAA